MAARVALMQPSTQDLGRGRDVHLYDTRRREVAEHHAVIGEVAFADQRDAVGEQLMHDGGHQVEDGDAERARSFPALRPELLGERLLERVLRDERQGERVSERVGRRRLARGRRAG